MNEFELLEATARKLRELAKTTTPSHDGSPPGWGYLDEEESTDPDLTEVTASQYGGPETVAAEVRWGDAAWISLLSPHTVLPLADYIDRTANRVRVELMVAGDGREQSRKYVQDKYKGLLEMARRIMELPA